MLEYQIQHDRSMRFLPSSNNGSWHYGQCFSWDLISHGSYSYSCSIPGPFLPSQELPYWCQWEYLCVGCRISYEYVTGKIVCHVPLCFWSDKRDDICLLTATTTRGGLGMTAAGGDHGSEHPPVPSWGSVHFPAPNGWRQLNSFELLSNVTSHLGKAVE